MKTKYCVRLFCLFLLFTSSNNYTLAQSLFRGVVADAETGQPVEAANVQLLYGKGQRLVNYALTDAKGLFSLPTGKQGYIIDSLSICISLLGYEQQIVAADLSAKLQIRLTPKLFSLREVEVRPGRVWGRQDTINYEVAQFLSPKDNAIKDVIRKLPGVDVDDAGRISYNGKNISNFYVEGMDVTDGRYGQINNNLDARAVEKVQVLENHQPVRILKDKIKSEDIAINLKLKEDFKDKWMVTLQGGLGASSDGLLWDARLYALQLSRKNQSTYGYKTNNRGVDLTDEMTDLTSLAFNRTAEPATPSFLSMPSLAAPLKDEKMLFNKSHTLAANRVYKLNETAMLRINTGYIHDERKQQRGSETTYFQTGDTLRIAEQSNTHLRSDQGEIRVTLENNADSHFLNNRFTTSGIWDRASTHFSGNREVDQQIRRSDILVKNDFKTNWNRGKYTFEAQSFVRYNHLPGELIVDRQRQRLPVNQFYTDNSFSLFRKKGYITHKYMMGINGDINNIHNRYAPYFTPNWQLAYRKWQVWLNTPLVWNNCPGIDFSRLMVNPSLTIRYKYNYAWQFSAHMSFRESYGSITDLYLSSYRTDYLHTIQNSGALPVRRYQNYSLYGEYKNTVKEFFATLRLAYSRNWSNQTYEQMVTPEQVTLVAHPASNEGYNWQLQGTLSKSVYEWNMKMSLDYQFVHQKATMISQGRQLPYETNYILYEPKISWSPNRRWETSYQGNFRYGGNKVGTNRLSPLWNVMQKLNVSYDLFPVEVNLSADHYYNDVNSEKSVNAFFFDASLRWKTGSWQFDFQLSNLFDKKQYSYTQYNSLHSYTSWIHIRGRECLFSAQYRF
ncbi:TonB-dependent receptor [Parabacteroides sp. OttesenSCG-928-G06]|nr:TonB-dependent receptor [Parabacteroides sp. OttesenSCG-928-K15]MDL2281524.1 TonB-dependent receptor [Parabacteroides sp. OttesenSCG-928-G06]